MKQSNLQQPKKVGKVAKLTAMINGMNATGNGKYAIQLMQEKSMLLTNGGRAPIPSSVPNQRQKRKLAAQMRG